TRFSRDWSSDVCSSDLYRNPRHIVHVRFDVESPTVRSSSVLQHGVVTIFIPNLCMRGEVLDDERHPVRLTNVRSNVQAVLRLVHVLPLSVVRVKIPLWYLRNT